MPTKPATLVVAVAFALAACQATTSDPAAADAANGVAPPPADTRPAPAPSGEVPAGASDASTDADPLQAAYDEGKATAAEALDAADE